MNPLRLTPPQWRILRYLTIYHTSAARTGFQAGGLCERTNTEPGDLIDLANACYIAGRSHGSNKPPHPDVVHAAIRHRNLRVHLTPLGKRAGQSIEIASRALTHLRTHGPQTIDALEENAGVDNDTLTLLQDRGLIETTPCCPECGEPAQHERPAAWTPAWGDAPTWSHTDGEPLCPVVGSNGYEPATPGPADHRTALTALGRRYSDPSITAEQS
jgi:hypothetical protein